MNHLDVAPRHEAEPEVEENVSVSPVVREMTDDGRDVIKFLMSVMKGRIKTAKVADRMRAAVELLDRGYGKPRSSASMSKESDSDDGGPSISELGGGGVWPMEFEQDD